MANYRRMPLRDAVRWLLSSGANFSSRVLQSGIWSASLNVSNRLLQLAKTVVLARLLAPNAFGVIGIALVVVMTSVALTDISLDDALIQREEEDIDHFLNTTWTIQIAKGMVLTLLLYAAAPTIGALFPSNQLTAVIRAFSFIPLILGIENPAIVYFRKNLRFEHQFLYEVSGTTTNAAVSIGGALLLGNLWALVLGILAGDLVELIMSFVIPEQRPSIGFKRHDIKALFDFSKWAYLSKVVMYAINNGDDLFLGWFIGTSALGQYRVAFRFGSAPATEIANVVLGVMFPAFARIQNNTDRLRAAFFSVLELTLFAMIPAGVGLVLVAREFTLVVLGQQWLPMVPLLQVIAVSGVLRGIVESGRSLFRGVGIPEWDFRMNGVRLAIIILTIWPLTARFGVTGTALSLVTGVASTLVIWLYLTRAIMEATVFRYLRIAAVPMIGSAAMVVPVRLLKEATLFGLVAAIIAGAVTYLLVSYVLFRAIGRRPIAELKSSL